MWTQKGEDENELLRELSVVLDPLVLKVSKLLATAPGLTVSINQHETVMTVSCITITTATQLAVVMVMHDTVITTFLVFADRKNMKKEENRTINIHNIVRSFCPTCGRREWTELIETINS